MDSCTHTSPLIDIQPKKREFLCLREHEPKVAQVNFTNNTNRRSRKSISMRDEYFLIRGEPEVAQVNNTNAIRMVFVQLLARPLVRMR